MHSVPVLKKHCASWKELYIAALYESDRSKLVKRISEAQRAIQAERKKLFVSARDLRNIAQERQALDAASFFLQALASCTVIPPASVPRNVPQSRIE
jgi:hypothetical protein